MSGHISINIPGDKDVEFNWVGSGRSVSVRTGNQRMTAPATVKPANSDTATAPRRRGRPSKAELAARQLSAAQ